MSDYGKLLGPGKLEFSRVFDADIEKVWQFIVDPEKRKLWFCGGSTDQHVGGEIVLEFDHRRLSESAPPDKYASEETSIHRGEILVYDPPHKLSFAWFESEGGGVVEITLAATNGRTELLLVHTGIEGQDVLVSGLAGWHGHLDLMGEVLSGQRATDFWVRDQELEAEYRTLI